MDEGSRAAWVLWLREMKWDWFATLTYSATAEGASVDSARRGAQAWLRALRAIRPKAYAVVAIERGPHLGGWHAHVLVGGLGADPRWVKILQHAWCAHGPAHVVRYDPTLDPHHDVRTGVMPYLCKQGDRELEIIGTMKRYRPRHHKDR